MTKRPKINVALPEELLNSFAKALVPEIRAFYDSDEGKAYFEKWLAKHPEYDDTRCSRVGCSRIGTIDLSKEIIIIILGRTGGITMNVVIYARFSSHSQTEQSIEGQLKVCYEYAESHNYTIVGKYIDHAQSGKFDNRADFQKMIADSDKHTFEGVLVYQLDRFARNRYDSAIYKAKLKKNGVRVMSAKENISDDASGILIEGVLESMAEYYSVEIAQKINRGMAINAEKCLSNGSNPGLGYKVNKDRTFSVDEEEAAIVREIYERYASGETKAEIVKDLHEGRSRPQSVTSLPTTA